MFYRLAEERDIDEIYSLIKDAICNMENHHIFQWDTWYPTKADFLSDIRKRQLIVGILNCNIAVVYVINQECDKAYQNGEWKYPDCEYRNYSQIVCESCLSKSRHWDTNTFPY